MRDIKEKRGITLIVLAVTIVIILILAGISIDIVFNENGIIDKAKEIASNTLDNYTNSELEYYDFSFFLKWKGEEKDTVITGNKHHSLDAITWTNS